MARLRVATATGPHAGAAAALGAPLLSIAAARLNGKPCPLLWVVASHQLQPVLLLRQRGMCVLRCYQRWHPLRGDRAPSMLRLSQSVMMWCRNSCLGSRVVPPSAHGEQRKGGSRAEAFPASASSALGAPHILSQGWRQAGAASRLPWLAFLLFPPRDLSQSKLDERFLWKCPHRLC